MAGRVLIVVSATPGEAAALLNDGPRRDFVELAAATSGDRCLKADQSERQHRGEDRPDDRCELEVQRCDEVMAQEGRPVSPENHLGEGNRYLVCHGLGISSDEYGFPYLARWCRCDVDLIPVAAARAISTARSVFTDLGVASNVRQAA